MTDRIDKALAKLATRELEKIKHTCKLIRQHELKHLDLRKLKGHQDIFRVRVGGVRILFRIDDAQHVFVLAIERRSDTTYDL